MAQIKVHLSSATRVNGKTIPAGARQVSEADAKALRDIGGVTFLDEQPNGALNAPVGEFVIDRVATGAEALKVDAALAAHIEALKAERAAAAAVVDEPALVATAMGYGLGSESEVVTSPIGATTSPTSADKANERRTKPRADAQGDI